MSNLINMDEKARIAKILAERGEEAARGQLDAVYPPLQAPDPSAERFGKLYFGEFEPKSISWMDVNGELPEYSPEKGWSNLAPWASSARP